MARRKTADEAAFDRAYDTAVHRGRQEQPRASRARYSQRTGRITIELSNDAVFAFPADLVQGLKGANPADLADIEIYGAGTALHWERLDVDYELAALMAGIFGSRTWMRELGRLGGRVSTAAKARAARANGLKGGRPRKAG